MSRTRAEALVLVNWKGVFYERYLLDRHVTALEGANGSGKTTVMIAAYVVLLPDMSRLRFSNLGETGATSGDKGIWGRLGEPGRPSYAVFDFALADGRRLVAGVHLERKGEPSVEPTPFIIFGLEAGARLQELLLVGQGDHEVIPELHELRENAARLGGRLQVFASAREYFLALFDHGVTPLRLGTDEERNKLNEMLRTSMTGGISRALTSELRAFLLKEEAGLADTLQRMKANLDACKRTRVEVQESRRLEQEIGNVYEAGQAMFAAAFQATWERAEDLERRVSEAEAARLAAAESLAAAQHALAEVVAELEAWEARRASAEHRLVAAKDWHIRMGAALTAADEVARCQHAAEVAEAEEQQQAAARAEAEQSRDRRRGELRRAQDTYKRAAAGLADLQRGIEELHRRAGAYQAVMRRLREAEERIGGTAISERQLDARFSASRAQLADVDRARRSASTRLADVDDHHRRHGEAFAALRALVRREIAVDEAHSAAVEVLRETRALRALAERAPAIARDLREARALAERQLRVRKQAELLGVTLAEASASMVGSLLEKVESERTGLEEQGRVAQAELAGLKRTLEDAERRRGELEAREPQWRELMDRAARLGEHLGMQLSDRAGLDQARSIVDESLLEMRKSEEKAREAHGQLAREARELIATGGAFEPALLHLKDALEAELVAGSFEDVSVEEAGELEARLGPLAQALVVEDLHAAVRAAGARAEALPQVWLVSRQVELEELSPVVIGVETAAQDVVVAEGPALRISRVPARPRLGRRAREVRAAELRVSADERAKELEGLGVQRRRIEHFVEDGEALLAGHGIWLAGDPAPELANIRQSISAAVMRAAGLRSEVPRYAEAARDLRPRIDGLRGLLGEAFLLEPPDHVARAAELAAEQEIVLAAQQEVTRGAPFVSLLEEQLAVLRTPPLSQEGLIALRLEVEQLQQEREHLDATVEALAYVRANVEALRWSDAPPRLDGEQALVPALKAQLAEGQEAQELAESLAGEADDHYIQATSRWQEADGRRRLASQEWGAADDRFRAIGVSDPTKEGLQRAAEEASRLEVEARGLGARRDELLTEQGRQESRCKESGERSRQAEEKVASERREAEPAVARWERLRADALQHGLLAGTNAAGTFDVGGIRGQVNLAQAASVQRSLLLERLRTAQGGTALLAELEILRDGSDAGFADAYLGLWLAVRDWLRRRLPAQVAEVNDPREALRRLRDQLSNLEERLVRQENDLRGASEDVARGIDVQIRKARTQIQRLNKNLEGTSFGSIQAIQVRLQPVERMEQVLRALRTGAAQELLFQVDLPIEEALEEIFRRYGGGGRIVGQRLLDYREYIHLQVEIRRKAGPDWEIANPTRLSTGEAIGVGAALMMVVLTEWERDATVLRGKKAHGSLRFLFLDEANRLSHDNLGVLFDLCQTLDLQLLIAAPEVARAEGNTTYRLIRRTTGEGREEVLVSGRRIRADA